MGLRPTASKTALLLNCQYPFRPDIHVPEDEVGEAAHLGHRVHEAIEKGLQLPPEEQGYVDAAKRWIAAEPVKNTGFTDYELALAWDGTTVRPLGRGRESYDVWPEGALLCGTVDIYLSCSGFGDSVVADWKTSFNSAQHAREQLLTLALLTEASNMVAVELRSDGSYAEHHRTALEPWDLDEHAERLKAALAQVQTAEPVIGAWCTECFCPLRGSCPAYTQAAEEAFSSDIVPVASLARRRITDPIVTEEDARVTVAFIDAIEEWAHQKKKEAREWSAANGPVDMGDGYEWRETKPQEQLRYKGKEAYALAEKLGASPYELAELTTVSRFTKFQRVKKKGFKATG